jgi:cysteine desulfurase family protein (TIGR01976 family)
MTATVPDSLDSDAIRSRFSALSLKVAGARAVYLDGPGGSQTPDSVAQAVAGYLTTINANQGGRFLTSQRTSALLNEARLAAADFLGCKNEEVVFGANTITINFLLAHAMARTLASGDEIIVTEIDHDANVSPWLLVAADRGLTIRTAPLDPRDGTLDLDALEALISGRTRVVACTLASNALGSITEIGRVVDAAHAVGALAWVDAVHMAPHRRLDRAGSGVDVLLTSAYKYFGPHLGVAAVRDDLARSLPADRVRPAEQEPAGHRFETGTLCHEALAGFVVAIDYLASLGAPATSPALTAAATPAAHQTTSPPDSGETATPTPAPAAGSALGATSDRRSRLDRAYARIRTHEHALTAHTLEQLRAIPGLRLYGIAEPERAGERTPTFCLNLRGWDPAALSAALGERGLFTYDGNYYALGVMTALGLETAGGAVRAGYLHYTTPEEVDRFCDTLVSLAQG